MTVRYQWKLKLISFLFHVITDRNMAREQSLQDLLKYSSYPFPCLHHLLPEFHPSAQAGRSYPPCSALIPSQPYTFPCVPAKTDDSCSVRKSGMTAHCQLHLLKIHLITKTKPSSVSLVKWFPLSPLNLSVQSPSKSYSICNPLSPWTPHLVSEYWKSVYLPQPVLSLAQVQAH